MEFEHLQADGDALYAKAADRPAKRSRSKVDGDTLEVECKDDEGGLEALSKAVTAETSSGSGAKREPVAEDLGPSPRDELEPEAEHGKGGMEAEGPPAQVLEMEAVLPGRHVRPVRPLPACAFP